MLLFLALSGLTIPALAADVESEVQYLIQAVAESGCTFNRNGTDHDSADAADHMRLKYSRGTKYVDSAEQFIDRLASESSWSGKAYTVDCDGDIQPTKDWFYQALDEYRRH